jgi:hypothetical protein
MSHVISFGYGFKKWWEMLVMLQSSLPVLFYDTRFTVVQPEHLPEVGLPGSSSKHVKNGSSIIARL